MTNAEIAAVFEDIAGMLRLKKDNVFKIRAYEKVARSISELDVPVEQLASEGRLKEIPGAGEAIVKKITELVTTGRLGYYDRLKAEFQKPEVP
jgi:DNA polymerase (family 10)